MSIVDNVGERSAWLGSVASLILRIQMLETQISQALVARPTHRQAVKLVEADYHLSEAVTALQEAAARVGGIV